MATKEKRGATAAGPISLSKPALAIGGTRFGLSYLAVSVAALAAGAAIAFVGPWS